MSSPDAFHVVIAGWDQSLVLGLWSDVARQSELRFSHIMHPREVADTSPRRADLHYFRQKLDEPLPPPDTALLASLEREGVPTVHNMILGDRVVSTLDYPEALAYATLLTQRLHDLLGQLRPSVVVGGFDSLHSGLALAVARKLGIPWFALNFSVIPPGLACFCDQLSPAARVQLGSPDLAYLRVLAESTLARFEARSVAAPAYITPPGLSVFQQLARLPARLGVTAATLRRARQREFLKFTEDRTDYSLIAALRHLWHVRLARKSVARVPTVARPPRTPYVFFGLHTQPESSIDVWAPFFSRQDWVIETLARAIPPSHKLLIKVHKSDAARYSLRQLRQLCAFPGVELVEPFADARQFVDQASLIVSIQGTMGLEAALLGKPVIMLGDSPTAMFPSVSSVGEIAELPQLVRRKLLEPPPSREDIIEAYTRFLAPFQPATHNDWTRPQSEAQLRSIAGLFDSLRQHIELRPLTTGTTLREAM